MVGVVVYAATRSNVTATGDSIGAWIRENVTPVGLKTEAQCTGADIYWDAIGKKCYRVGDPRA